MMFLYSNFLENLIIFVLDGKERQGIFSNMLFHEKNVRWEKFTEQFWLIFSLDDGRIISNYTSIHFQFTSQKCLLSTLAQFYVSLARSIYAYIINKWNFNLYSVKRRSPGANCYVGEKDPFIYKATLLL